MNAHAHVESYVGRLDDRGDRVYNVETHLDTTVSMIGTWVRETRNAIIAVPQNLDPEAVIILRKVLN